jgi:phosphoribosylformylglycinamidine synthase PurS subunit
MLFLAEIDIMPHPELLDPQGKAVLHNLDQIDVKNVADVRIGRHITLSIEAESASEARLTVEKACQNLLANPIVELYRFTIQPA